MPVGGFFDGFSSTAEMLESCRDAELAGASSLWFAQHMGYREAMVWAGESGSQALGLAKGSTQPTVLDERRFHDP
jgi:hypothetical protein